MSVGRFIAGIAAVLWREDDNTYLILRRSAQKDHGAGHWETVTGRVDQGESYIEALHREVKEETGLAIKLEFVIGCTHFYRGESVPENELLGVIFCCTTLTPDALVRSDEHDAHKWVTLAEVQAMFPADNWLRRSLERADLMNRLLPADLQATMQAEGYAF